MGAGKISRRALLMQGSAVMAGLAFARRARGQAPKPRNTVTVLNNGYGYGIEGHQRVPFTAPDGEYRGPDPK